MTTLKRASAGEFFAAGGEPPFGGRLREEKRRGEIDLEHGVPIGFGVVHDGGAADDAGVVDEDVEAAAVGDDLRDERGGGFLVEGREIARIGGEPGAERFHFGGDVRGIADAYARDVRAFAGEGQGDGLADATARTRDDGYFILEALRGFRGALGHEGSIGF